MNPKSLGAGFPTMDNHYPSPDEKNFFNCKRHASGNITSRDVQNACFSERAKGAEKASCGETVVQKGVFGESVSSLPP